MTTIARTITGGVDTHLDVHVAAALDERGALLGIRELPDHAAGYVALLDWLEALRDRRARRGRGDRQLRGRTDPPPAPPGDLGGRSGSAQPPDAAGAQGKSDTLRRGGCGPGRPRWRCHRIGQDQGPETSRPCGYCGSPGRSARRSRTQAINQMRSLISTAPDELRAELRDLSIYKVLELCQCLSPHRPDRRDGGDQAHACARWHAGLSPSKTR